MVKKLLVAMVLSIFALPVAYAGGLETTPVATTDAEVSADDLKAAPSSYVDPYYNYGSGISFSISLESPYQPGEMTIAANYDLYNETDKEGIKDKLSKKFLETKAALSKYGKVSKTNYSIYDEYSYDGMGMGTTSTSTAKTYHGYQDVRVKLSSASNYESAKTALEDLGYTNAYMDIQVSQESKINIEESLADKISDLIKKKKKVYEKILGYNLTKISSLYIDTWADSYRYDAETNSVPATVTITVGYQ